MTRATSLDRVLVLALIMTAMACSAGARPTTMGSEPARRERRALVDGVPILYHVYGTGPVVIAHPGGPGGDWSYLRMPELEKVATVVYVEPFGTGGSGRLKNPNGYTIKAYVKAVEAVRAALGVDKVVLLGHSHGGFVAQAYALSHPEHLRGLVLYDTSPVSGAELGADITSNLQWFAHEPWFPDAYAAFVGFVHERTDDEATAGARRMMPFNFADWTGRSKEFEAIQAQARMWIGPRQTIEAPSEFGTEDASFDVRPRLHEIATATLIIVGARDAICSPTMARMANDGIRASELVVLPRSGHMGHLEQPIEHARAIRDFLATLAKVDEVPSPR